jgi:hypothetical protein
MIKGPSTYDIDLRDEEWDGPKWEDKDGGDRRFLIAVNSLNDDQSLYPFEDLRQLQKDNDIKLDKKEK